MGNGFFFFFFQAEDGIRDFHVTGVQTCALPISLARLSVSQILSIASHLKSDILGSVEHRKHQLVWSSVPLPAAQSSARPASEKILAGTSLTSPACIRRSVRGNMSKFSATSSIIARPMVKSPAAYPARSALSQRLLMFRGIPCVHR